jgi:hypothetical protein
MADSRTVVSFADLGTMIDAPIDVVWDFMLHDEEFHPKAHVETARNFQGSDLNEYTFEGTCEVLRGGKWTKMRFRSISIPPIVRVVEDLEGPGAGPFAGSKMVFVYTPRGNKTSVDVFVHAVHESVSERELEQEFRASLESAHEEDLPMLREFSKNRASHNSKASSA